MPFAFRLAVCLFLVAAEQVLDIADISPSGGLLTVAPSDFYGESEWRDDLELGATELYFALASAERPLLSALRHTDPAHYLRAAAHWAHAYITGPNDAADTPNLYDVSGLAHFELFRAISSAGHPTKLEVSQSHASMQIGASRRHCRSCPGQRRDSQEMRLLWIFDRYRSR